MLAMPAPTEAFEEVAVSATLGTRISLSLAGQASTPGCEDASGDAADWLMPMFLENSMQRSSASGFTFLKMTYHF